MTIASLSTVPDRILLGDEGISVRLQKDATGETIEALVMVGRAHDQPLIPAEAIDATMVDAAGHPFTLIDRPRGVLYQLGGGLGVAAYAPFRFKLDAGRQPASLRVVLRGAVADFQIR